jgi:hypothetical protein
MNTVDSQVLPAPPNLIRALLIGFDTITDHIELIFFSIILDVGLWLGPHLHLTQLFQSVFDQFTSMPGMDLPDAAEMVRSSRELWMQVAQQFNLFSVLRTFPVGIPSLMASRSPIQIPAGQPSAWNVNSFWVAISLWLLLTFIGLALGALYFSVVAQATGSSGIDWRYTLINWPWFCFQIILLSLSWFALMIGASIPVSCLMSIILLIGVNPSPFVVFILGGLLAWMLLLLAFSPHGIFVHNYSLWTSVKEGIRLSRFTLPATGLFFLTILVLSEGLDVLWRVPPENSWLTLIGIAGHSFVTTGLLAATFVYYRDADRWMKRVIQQVKMGAINVRRKV